MRRELIGWLAKVVRSIRRNHPLRVGIDGVDASGKTRLADELANELKKQNRQVIRASVDGFHNSKELRYQKGRDSAEGYYVDSFDNNAIIGNLLAPLGSNGNLKYKAAIFDFRTDSKINSKEETAEKTAILVMDGVFLFRPELINYWDLKIFLNVDFDVAVQRAAKRDGYYLGTEQKVHDKHKVRYIPGQKIYFKDAKPREKADVVIDNNDFLKPRIVKTKF